MNNVSGLSRGVRDPFRSYQQIATQTASPGKLILMLYEGAIRFLEQALAGFREDDPLERNRGINNNIIRAQAIINELNNSLNMDSGGELSVKLTGLYVYLDRRLQESNAKKDPKGAEESLGRLRVLRDAWADMLEGKTLNPELTLD